MADIDNPLNAVQTSRLRMIELLAWWEGGVNTTHLCDIFGIKRQQASKTLTFYQQHCPQNLVYDQHARLYRATPEFLARFISGEVYEYLEWLEHGLSGARPPSEVTVDSLPLPRRHIAPELIRPLVQAMRHRCKLEVDYVSVSNPNRDGRLIVPVRFVKTGLRWHVRAWCDKNRDYRDFVLSRFRGIPSIEKPIAEPLPSDDAWETSVCLKLRPDPRLSAAQQETLVFDYGMQAGELHLYTRAALARYLLDEMQVSYKILDGNPAAQQLVLVNYSELRQWLF